MPIRRSTGLAVVLVLAGITPAQAYIDPGTGTLILQGVIGVIAGGLVFFRRAIASTLGRLRRRPVSSRRSGRP